MKNWFVLTFVILSCACPYAAGQAVTGSLVGTVTDQTGAVLPGVSVTLSRVETGFQRETVTDERGDFQFLFVPASIYAIQADLPGFKSEVRRGVTIQTDVRSRVDFKMALGEASEKIFVTEDAPLLRSETSEVGTVINSRTVHELPLNGRQFQNLAFVAPGVTLPAPGSTIAFRGSISVAGKREGANVFILDGIDITQQNIRQPVIKPSVDAIQEFKMQTWNYSAEAGRQSGGQVNVSTKSGTNAIHGVLFEFLRNEVLDAKNYFDQPTAKKPPLRRNNFGGTIGGPIFKDRTFFFLSYEGFRESYSFTKTATVPFREFFDGDFSALLRQPKPVQLVDPLTKNPFPGNIIPRNRLNTAAGLTRSIYPEPNLGAAGALTGNYVSSAKRTTATEDLTGRLDHRFSDRHSIFGRYSFENTNIIDPYDDYAGISNLPNFPRLDKQRAQALSINETWAITPKVVNEFRTGFSRFVQFRQNTNLFNFNGAAGFKNFESDPLNYTWPAMQVAGYVIGKSGLPAGLSDTNLQLVNSLSVTKGKHTIKVGTDILRYYVYKYLNSNYSGTYTFSGGLSGYSFADFLLGMPVSASRKVGDTHTYMSQTAYAFYLQDDWKTSSRLTLNLGVRYDVFTPLLNNVSERYSRFNTGTRTLEIAGKASNPRRDVARPENIYPGLAKASAAIEQVDLGYDNMWNTAWNDISPRVGFAFRLKTSTVLRGGYGVFKEIDATSWGGAQGLGNNFPFVATQSVTSTPNAPDLFFAGDPFAAATTGDIAISSVDVKRRTPYVQNWNVGMEQELIPNLMLDVSYVGSSSAKLYRDRNINQPYTDGDSRAINQRRPIPGLGNIVQEENASSANFHSLQAKVEKRFSQGLQLTGAYLWGHSIDDHSGIGGTGSTNGQQNAWDLRSQRGRSTFDVRQRLVVNYVYELPFGHERRFLGGIGKVPELVLGGWQFGGVASFQSGNPLTITVSGNNSNVGGTDRADVVPGVSPKPSNHTPQRFFNTDAFAMPARFRFGNSGRNIIDGPGVQQLDVNLVKNFSFTESKRIQFRAEFFNVLNHPNLFPPVTTINDPNFGKILNTGSFTSRQIQFALKLYY